LGADRCYHCFNGAYGGSGQQQQPRYHAFDVSCNELYGGGSAGLASLLAVNQHKTSSPISATRIHRHVLERYPDSSCRQDGEDEGRSLLQPNRPHRGCSPNANNSSTVAIHEEVNSRQIDYQEKRTAVVDMFEPLIR